MEIYVSNGDGTNPVRLTNNAYSEFFPTWSPNGHEIVFDANDAGPAPRDEKNLYIMNDDGSERRLLTHGSSASWSPNGKQLVFHDVPGLSPADSDVFVVNADGSGRTNLTNNPGFDTDADWSPDGRKILFTSDRDGGINIYVMNADGSDVTRLTFDGPLGENAGPDWSPNGKRIVFARRYPGHPRFEIYVMNADGSDPTRLTFNNALDATPAWSPNGKEIVFHSNRSSPRPQLYVMNADGTDQRALPATPGRNQWANWGNGHAPNPE
jgi:TolB protein